MINSSFNWIITLVLHLNFKNARKFKTKFNVNYSKRLAIMKSLISGLGVSPTILRSTFDWTDVKVTLVITRKVVLFITPTFHVVHSLQSWKGFEFKFNLWLKFFNRIRYKIEVRITHWFPILFIPTKVPNHSILEVHSCIYKYNSKLIYKIIILKLG